MIKDIGYLTILKTGPGTSVQDKGRIGFAQFGVPISGALDSRSFNWVNHLLQNKPSDAVLEISQPGLKFHFDAPTMVCLAGAISEIKLNGKIIIASGIQAIRENDQLEVGAFHRGSVLYLGIKNGFQSENIMDSRSWYQGITAASFVKKGDQIAYFTTQGLPLITASRVKWSFNWVVERLIDVYPGPDWDLLDTKNQELLEKMKFTISNLKNRMAIQLTELLPNSLPEMATAPVFPGTVQLTSGGKLIILMRDAQVTGGYPRILQLTEEALAILAQKKPTEKIKFQLKELIEG